MRQGLLKKQNRNRGMSLVELMCVMVILSVVMLAVMSLYIPAQRATVTTTQVSDVQSNLRLALRVMTRDILTAGFLMTTEPIVFPDANSNDPYADVLDDRGTNNASEFLIRTRIVGNNFARIDSGSAVGNLTTLTVSQADMIVATDGVNRFPQGSYVRIFDSVGATEVIPDAALADDKRAYRVDSSSGTTIVIDTNPSGSGLASGLATLMANDFTSMQAVLVKVRDENQPPLQTIKYRLANGTLERYVNGNAANTTNRQILARTLDTTNPAAGSSRFDFFEDTDGNINRVDIKLVGRTSAGKAGTLSEQKTREILTTVKIRNVQ